MSLLSFDKQTNEDVPIAYVTQTMDGENDGAILYVNVEKDIRPTPDGVNTSDVRFKQYTEVLGYSDDEYTDEYEPEPEPEPEPGVEKLEGSTDIMLRDGKFIPIPSNKRKSNIFTLAGANGSGKTYLCVQIAQMYQLMYPNRKIFLFSETALTEENQKLFKRLKNVQVVMLDGSLITNPIKLEELKESFVIFDDFNTLGTVTVNDEKGKPKKHNLSKAVQELRDKLLQNSRHYNIDVAMCIHMLFNYKETRTLLEESHYTIYYTDGTGQRHVNRLLSETLGLDKKTIKKIISKKSRWTMISKNVPKYVLTEYEAFII